MTITFNKGKSLINPSDIAFTESVKIIQTRKGSRKSYEKMYGETPRASGFTTEVTQDLANYIALQRSVFLSTVNKAGQPYIQHRGGPPGFIKILDKHTLAFADFKGNQQYISQGNLTDNPKAFLFLIDYENRSRIKIWGEAEVIEDDEKLLQSLMPPANEYRARPEQVILFRVKVWDGNCPQHIPIRVDAAALEHAVRSRDEEIARLKQKIQTMS